MMEYRLFCRSKDPAGDRLPGYFQHGDPRRAGCTHGNEGCQDRLCEKRLRLPDETVIQKNIPRGLLASGGMFLGTVIGGAKARWGVLHPKCRCGFETAPPAVKG